MKKIFKRGLIAVVSIILFPVVAFIIFFTVMFIFEYRPENSELIYSCSEAEVINNDTIKVVTWNIGYCGLGDDMDFFYDGGQTMRTSLERTQQNMDSIISFLQRNSDADFILLQEIDIDSHRSWNINQVEAIKVALPQFNAYFAYNYNSLFVPMPVDDPMGKTKSGLMILSKNRASLVERLQYPGSFSFLMSPFNLKRAGLKALFPLANGKELTVINTHNSAFDDGGMRRAEMKFLDSLLTSTPYGIVCGDWNSTPPGYIQSKAESTNPYFQPLSIDSTFFKCGYHFVYDENSKTTRYGYEPYRSGQTTETLLDLAFVSSDFEIISADMADMKFRYSDHNPVVFLFGIK